MRQLIVRLLHPFLRKGYAWWNAEPRSYKADGLDLLVLPGVFHPGLFASTGLMAAHVASLDLRGKNFLELGAGTGRVALIAARNGARVTASDINPTAIENVRVNAARNKLAVEIVLSDLFDRLPERYEVIAINPPYYQREPSNDAERAFFAGSGLEYFQRLFPELAKRLVEGAQVFMVLSADLDHTPITALAARSGLRLAEVKRKSLLGEAQVIHAVLR